MKPTYLGGLAAVLLAAACAKHPSESGVKSIEAQIDGLTCPTCVPPLLNSLKRRFQSSAIDVNDDTDTARITFAGPDAFSTADFQSAVERVRMHVVSVKMQACGTVEEAAGQKVLVAGSNRFAVRADGSLPVNQPVCAEGSLDARSDPPAFQVSSFSLQAAR